MSFVEISMLFLIICPILAATSELFRQGADDSTSSKTFCYAGSIIPMLLSAMASVFLADTKGVSSFTFPFLSVMEITWRLEADALCMTVLTVILACFSLCQVLGRYGNHKITGNFGLILLLQAGVTAMVLSRSLLAFAFVQIIAAFVLFLIYKNSLGDDRGSSLRRFWAAEKFLGFQFASAISIIVISGLLAFKFGNVVFDFAGLQGIIRNGQVDRSLNLALLVLVPFLLALPVIPWLHWFAPLYEHRRVSPALNIVLNAFLSAVVFVYYKLFYSVLGASVAEYGSIVPLIGLVLCISNVVFLMVERSVRRKLAYLMGYLFSFSVFTLGFLDQNSQYVGVLLVMLAPILAGATEYFCVRAKSTKFAMVLFVSLTFYIVGVPGTPVFYLFILSSASSFAIDDLLSYVSILLWILYFWAVVNCLYSVWVRREGHIDQGDMFAVEGQLWEVIYRRSSLALMVICVLSIVVTNLLGFVFL